MIDGKLGDTFSEEVGVVHRRGLQTGIFYVARCVFAGVFTCEPPPAKKTLPGPQFYLLC